MWYTLHSRPLSGCDTFLRVILYKKTTLITENNKNLQRYKVLIRVHLESREILSPKLVDDAAGE
jgi:hypothetical protein